MPRPSPDGRGRRKVQLRDVCADKYCVTRGRGGPATLAQQVHRSFRSVLVTVVLIVLVVGARVTWASLVSQPAVDRLTAGLAAVDDAHLGMLDQETGLRAYLTTGDVLFLQPVDPGRGDVARAHLTLDRLAADAQLGADVGRLRLAEQRWVVGWADRARTGAVDQDALAGFLMSGKTLFDQYRDAHETLRVQLARDLAEARSRDRLVAVATSVAVLALAFVMFVLALRRQRRLRAVVVEPVAELLGSIRHVRDGRLDVPTALRSERPLRELAELSDGLAEMVTALAEARAAGLTRERLLEEQGDRLRHILEMTREMSGSLSLRYVAETTATSTRQLADCDRVVVYVSSEQDGTLEAVHDTGVGSLAGAQRCTVEVGDGVVGRVAASARATSAGPTEAAADVSDDEPWVDALPLVVGARVVGVLECRSRKRRQQAQGGASSDVVAIDPAALGAVEMLAVHAGSSIEAARLHGEVERLAEADALTGLANRRRLNADLDAEVARASRYGRPLAFVMLDLDHFKRLNDTFGHQHGDVVLQEVAALISGSLRSTDTAYRYGGEELAVLVRESDAESAGQLAERLRGEIEARFSAPGEPARVTASFGVAETTAAIADAESLVRAADAALYRAKRAGRNRVELAQADVPSLVPAPR